MNKKMTVKEIPDYSLAGYINRKTQELKNLDNSLLVEPLELRKFMEVYKKRDGYGTKIGILLGIILIVVPIIVSIYLAITLFPAVLILLFFVIIPLYIWLPIGFIGGCIEHGRILIARLDIGGLPEQEKYFDEIDVYNLKYLDFFVKFGKKNKCKSIRHIE